MKRFSAFLTMVLCAATLSAQTNYDLSKIKMENLGRGVIAVRQSPSEVFVTWRYLTEDSGKVKFDVYRNGEKVNQSPISDVTYFVDSYASSAPASYEVRTTGGKGKSGSFTLPAKAPVGYIPIALSIPENQVMPDGGIAKYSPNDCSIGDVDGDGEFEIIMKWDPSNARDNAHNGYSGTVFIDCIKITGERLWRVDLGKNIRGGAHYTQLMVYDLDGDGKAEVVVKTADGTVDGTGKVIGDAKADYRESAQNLLGRILNGKEYLTVFNGQTGAAMQTIDYTPARGEVASWGDRNANRCDRFLAAIAYLDGVHPSVIMCRGYYTRATLAAYDWDGKDLKLRWFFDSHSSDALKAFDGQGNHNLRVADIDGDGCDEIVYGSCCIDHDGTGLYSNGLKHGDSMHIGQMIPGSKELQVWIGHESTQCSALVDARTGKMYWKIPSNTDVGRSMAADIDPTNPGWEMWSSASGTLRNYKGEKIGEKPASTNFAAWWDGDLSRELLDGNRIEKYNPQTKKVELLQRFEGASSINGSKSVPNVSGDLFGDWREEVLLRAQDNSELRLYVSTIPTDYRFHTFLQDPVYRVSIANENVTYNQPPETSFYFGEDLSGTTFRGTKISGEKKKFAPYKMLEDVLLDSVIIGRQRMPMATPKGAAANSGDGPNGTPGWRPANAQGQRPQQGQAPRTIALDNSYKDNTPDSLDLAKTARPVSGSSRKGNNPVLFLVGDSTMRTGTRGNGDNGQWGWGFYAGRFFDQEKITVENHALGGLSIRTFYTGWWPDVVKGIQKGDYVILQLGHNDSGPLEGRSAILSDGHETKEITKRDGSKETVYTFGDYLRKYAAEIRAKGAYPIFFTLTPRNQWDDGKIRRKNDSYNIWIRNVGKELGIPVIEFEEKSASDLETFSRFKIDYMFYKDNIHSSEYGALHNAQMAAKALKETTATDLGKYLLPFEQTMPEQEFKREKGKPALIVTGDSTIQNNDSDPDGMWGWGSVLETVFDPSRITLVNAGKAGRSARTFLDEGRWEKVYNAIRPGDYVVIQFGHNDFGGINTAPGRGEIRNTSDSTKVFFMMDRHYEVVRSYGWYLRKFIDDVREKGATPILVSTTPRNEWPEGKIERREEFARYMEEVKAQTGVDFVDMMNITADYYDSIGKEAAAKYFKNDHTHSSRFGAERNAKSFAEGLKKADHPLAKYLKK